MGCPANMMVEKTACGAKCTKPFFSFQPIPGFGLMLIPSQLQYHSSTWLQIYDQSKIYLNFVDFIWLPCRKSAGWDD